MYRDTQTIALNYRADSAERTLQELRPGVATGRERYLSGRSNLASARSCRAARAWDGGQRAIVLAQARGSHDQLSWNDDRLAGLVANRVHEFLDEQTLASMFTLSKDIEPVPVEINRLDNQVLVRYYEGEWRKFE